MYTIMCDYWKSGSGNDPRQYDHRQNHPQPELMTEMPSCTQVGWSLS